MTATTVCYPTASSCVQLTPDTSPMVMTGTTTADMGFPLTEEPNEVLCPKDVREGKATDRFIAPAISRFATTTIAGAGGGAETSRPRRPGGNWFICINDGANLAGQQKGIAFESWLAMTPMRRANSPELYNARISHGSETPSQEWLMIRCTSRIAMFRLGRKAFLFHEPMGKWTGVPPSYQEVVMVAAQEISQEISHVWTSEGLST